eukprot:Phypoly_transcript_08780.p1 GENE.Phypoly_transcript_08780~~Phypoly_transcript_08780.p1  ORF type:complete len:438 (+),score=128.42 Phypoly_transcript_08780:151-1464(+)
MRMMVQAGTIDAILRGSYFLPDGNVVRLSKNILERAALKTRMYTNDFDYSTPAPNEEKGQKGPKNKEQKAEEEKKQAQDKVDQKAKESNTEDQKQSPSEKKGQKSKEKKIVQTEKKKEETEQEEEEEDKEGEGADMDAEEDGEDEEEDFGTRDKEEVGEEGEVEGEEAGVEEEGDEEEEEEEDEGGEDEEEDAELEAKFKGMKIEMKEEDKIFIVEGDSIEVGLWLKKRFDANPVVLNMASMNHPGGGYRSGSGAQEESLHRRTNLFQCLEDPYLVCKNRSWSYPIPEFGGIYSPNVAVIRSSEEQGYAFKTVPESISFVSVAAYSNPPTETLPSEEVVLSKKIAQLTRKKIETIFKIAIHNGHDALVLGAFGCGAYCNPAQHIAKLFNEALAIYKSHFRKVVFAILDAKTAINPEGNLAAFSDGLKCKVFKLRDLE